MKPPQLAKFKEAVLALQMQTSILADSIGCEESFEIFCKLNETLDKILDAVDDAVSS